MQIQYQSFTLTGLTVTALNDALIASYQDLNKNQYHMQLNNYARKRTSNVLSLPRDPSHSFMDDQYLYVDIGLSLWNFDGLVRLSTFPP